MKSIGHLFRHNSFLRNIFEGKILDKRTRGRPRTSKTPSSSWMSHLIHSKERWQTTEIYAYHYKPLDNDNDNKVINTLFLYHKIYLEV